MDTTTHALAGYIIVKSGLNRETGRWGTIAGVSASLFPDVDGILGIFFGTEFYLEYHRSLTNSILFVIPFSVIFSWLFVKISGGRKFRSFLLIWMVELLVHTFLDLATSYGTMLLSPLSKNRFSLDWLFIIDPFLSSAFLLPIVALWIWKDKGRSLARGSLVLAVLYISLCAWSHFWALSLAKNYADENGLVPRKVASLPQPLSPFHWGNFVVTREKILVGFVNLIGTVERVRNSEDGFLRRISARYQPISHVLYQAWDRLDDSPWVRKSLDLAGVQQFLWFARFPTVRYRGIVDGKHRVEFFDLRFGSIEGRRPFLYLVDFDLQGRIVFQGFMKKRAIPHNRQSLEPERILRDGHVGLHYPEFHGGSA